MKATTCKDLAAVHPEDWPPNGIIPAGTVLESEQIFKFVQHGAADPADEECRIRAGMDDAEIKLAKYRQRRLAAGIHYDDIDAYDQGLMVGYDDDGKWIPGPNAETAQPEDEYEEEYEEDDEFDDDEPVKPEEEPETEEETKDE